eukprot:scaffold7537_cov179-Ochromonas_danica.AAC.2
MVVVGEMSGMSQRVGPAQHEQWMLYLAAGLYQASKHIDDTSTTHMFPISRLFHNYTFLPFLSEYLTIV